MGTKVAAARNYIYIEGSQFRNAVSEDLLQRSAATNNFILDYEFVFFEFGFLKAISSTGSPTYNTFTPSNTVISDFESFATKAIIQGICLEHNTSGSSGTTTLDIQWSTQNSGSWATIFSTKPAVASTAPTDAQFDTFGNATTPTGCTVPVLSKTTFNAGDRLRCICTAVQGGTPNGFMMRIYYVPTV